MMTKSTICLNMIVKNESHIILSTLKNVLEHINIDYWVISDTGSTDDTIDIINKFFEERGIPGEMFCDEWKDFGHNRTKALEHAFGKSDYLFIFDADDLIKGNMNLPLILDKDCYNIQFENPVSYHRSILISNKMKWKFRGILHESIVPIDTKKSEEYLGGDYCILSRRLGNRSKNPDKYLDDAILLENAYNSETDIGLQSRYAFYCAQSYKDSGRNEISIKWYTKVLTLCNWNQEKYYSCMMLGELYRVKKDYINAIKYWGESYNYDKERIECIANIMEYYYNIGQHFMVSSLYNKFKDMNVIKQDKLFIDDSKYQLFHYYASVSGSYCDEGKSAYEACKYLLLNNSQNTDNTLYNINNSYIKYFKEDKDNIYLVDFFINYLSKDPLRYIEKNWKNIINIINDKYPDKYDLIKNSINKKSIDKNDKYSSSNKILVYTGWMTHLWNESHLDRKALGGSEKAVAYLMRELPNNYEIIVSGDVEEGTFDNITYIHQNKLQTLLDENEFHTIIISRYINFLTEYNNLKCFQLVLSLHDIHILNNGNNTTQILERYNTVIDTVITLTNWHKSHILTLYPILNPDKIKIINNGIDISQFNSNNSSNKIKNKFVWSSRSERGLHIILNLWNEIIDKLPDATLDICSYGDFPINEQDNKMLKIINSYNSITYHGKLNTKELYNIMSISEYWLYTTNFTETSCITAMEMLMSEVICLYYPIAGLNDTLGDYGIPINQGEEIETLVHLSTEKKTLLREKGKEYALSCSWTNRAEEWSTMLGLNKTNNKIGIFNSFPFHYEMFGFILNYAQNNNYKVDIFTNQINTLGWFDFYKENFNNFNIIDFNIFQGNTSDYFLYFLSTDDDPDFKSEWKSDNVICLNHYYKIRNPNFKHYLNVANFKDSSLEYSYPCYPLINYQDKIQNTTVCIVGGNIDHINNNYILDKLYSKHKIKLNIFTRKICNTNISNIDTNKFDIHFIEDIETRKMIKILKQSSYVLINYNNNDDHNTGISCSGSLQLALSTLCKPIIINTANQYLKIENALEYDIDSHEPINIDDEIDFKVIEEERNKYVDKFDKYLNNIKQSYNFEHDKVNISLLDNIKDYKSIYQNYMNRGNTEIMFRKLINYIMPYFKDKNIIDLGAYIGDNSIPWALKSNGIIYAIDPSKENTDFIDKMAKHNKLDNIVTITKAISDKSETIYYNENDDTHIYCNTISGNSSFDTTILDNLNLDNIGFIHLDVEGFEYKVLNGSTNIINKYNPIIVWENHIEKEDYMKIVNFFSSHNYNTFLINEQFPHCHPDCRNFISLPNTSHININNINEKFKETYKEFTPDKNKPFLIEMNNLNIVKYSNIPKKIFQTLEHSNIEPNKLNLNKKISLLTYGQLRTFKNNFRNNLTHLSPIFKNYENIYMFILLDETLSNEELVETKYKENCEYIENICKEFNIKIGFIKNINNLNYKQEEIDYCNELLLQKNDDKIHFPNNFVLKLLYRKYKLIELVEEYCIDNKLEISYFLYARLFDCIIKQNIPSNDIYLNIKNTNLSKHIYFSPDTIFIGNYNLIKKVMKFDKIYNSDELWNNKDFCNFSYRFDSILTNNKDTYAPEIQYTANIYFQSINAYNLRYYRPDPNCLDKNLMYEIILDPNRHTNNSNEYSNDFINLNLTTKNIIEITNRLDNKYLKYFSDSGFNDYKQLLGKEHYKLFCAISSQIDNGIIIDIGTHHGNSAIALGYNLYKNINNICNRPLLYTFDIKDFRANSCKKFMNNYSVHYSLENIFNCNIRDKYKNALLESKLIIIDIDPHNGVLEYELYNWLFENNYKGLILFDDIYLTQGHVANGYESTTQSMEIFWNKIPNKYKLDLTHIGHLSGTGLVSFNTNNTIKLDSINIPKKIFQTWEHINIEPEFQQIINKWKEYNPEYEYIFHNAEQRIQFIKDNFEENIVNAYNKIIPGAYKCDLWRYCVLYTYGGFYADIDTLCMGKLNDLTNYNTEFIVPIDLNINPREGQHNLACGFIGSVSKSPILLDAINRIVFNVENNIIPTSKLDFSGPGLLGRAVNKFLKLEETNSFIGKEGIQNNIHFLKFDPNTEYISDIENNKNILQNKNKNQEIIRLYNNECKKIKNYTCWVSSNKIIK